MEYYDQAYLPQQVSYSSAMLHRSAHNDYQSASIHARGTLADSAPMSQTLSSGSNGSNSSNASQGSMIGDTRASNAYGSSNHPTASPTRRLSRSGRSSAERSHDRYVCLFDRCNSNFSRPADLARHQMTVHCKQKCLIDCPELLCTRKGDNGFTRQDHLTEHLRKFHSHNISKRQSRSSPSHIGH